MRAISEIGRRTEQFKSASRQYFDTATSLVSAVKSRINRRNIGALGLAGSTLFAAACGSTPVAEVNCEKDKGPRENGVTIDFVPRDGKVTLGKGRIKIPSVEDIEKGRSNEDEVIIFAEGQDYPVRNNITSGDASVGPITLTPEGALFVSNGVNYQAKFTPRKTEDGFQGFKVEVKAKCQDNN